MGQAKNRGTLAQRLEQAKTKRHASKPATLECNHCHAILANIEEMDSRSMTGIDAVFTALCECGNTSYAIAGDPKHVAIIQQLLEDDLEDDGAISAEVFIS